MAFGQYMGMIGTVVGAVIGGVIGSYFPGVGTAAGVSIGGALGGALGGVAGSVFFPEKADLNLPPPPQPHETRQQISTYGAAIPIQYGSGRMSGNIIRMSPVVETVDRSRHRQNGVRYYEMVKTYTATFAMCFCEGPVPGVARIWVNGKIFADFRDPNGPYYPTGSTALASANLDTSIARSATFFSIYLGSETQTADAALVALFGAAAVPAYRGRCYIVFIDFPVGEYSGIPHIEIEVTELIELESWTSIDFTDGWTEADLNTLPEAPWSFLSLTATKAQLTALGNYSYTALYKYPSPNIGPGTFRFGFTVTALGGSSNYQIVDMLTLRDAVNFVNVLVSIDVSHADIELKLNAPSGPSSDSHVYSFALPFTRYVKLSFPAAGQAQLEIYTDAAYSVLEDTLIASPTGQTASPVFDFINVAASTSTDASDRDPITMSIDNLQTGAAA
jgi:hypothetical protein